MCRISSTKNLEGLVLNDTRSASSLSGATHITGTRKLEALGWAMPFVDRDPFLQCLVAHCVAHQAPRRTLKRQHGSASPPPQHQLACQCHRRQNGTAQKAAFPRINWMPWPRQTQVWGALGQWTVWHPCAAVWPWSHMWLARRESGAHG